MLPFAWHLYVCCCGCPRKGHDDRRRHVGWQRRIELRDSGGVKGRSRRIDRVCVGVPYWNVERIKSVRMLLVRIPTRPQHQQPVVYEFKFADASATIVPIYQKSEDSESSITLQCNSAVLIA
ncbi:hypothetical protein ZHAS_00007420 [Anopheles sinensis]|uniref:Uncharacterized protein n=1 Tax=Anopheles sinensis TaxID=74873 RepID=A0A084VP34_ANOSI|nr:hypothetical protein ZHAS_00007420 [Anopheles sinensis]